MASQNSYGFQKQLNHRTWNIRLNICNIKPLKDRQLNECWPLLMKDGNTHPIQERRIIHFPINDNCIWRIRYNNENHKLCSDLDIVNFIKIGSLRWLGQLFKIQEMDPCSKLTVLKQQSSRRAGKPKLR